MPSREVVGRNCACSSLSRCSARGPRPPRATWHEHFRHLLADALEHGDPSITALARRLAISPRTLQRRLAEHGTTWRAELDRARQALARHYSPAGPPGVARLARQLGYYDPRSVRRALLRWDDDAAELPGHS
jgi:AraC-like DNA-binding protein